MMLRGVISGPGADGLRRQTAAGRLLFARRRVGIVAATEHLGEPGIERVKRKPMVFDAACAVGGRLAVWVHASPAS